MMDNTTDRTLSGPADPALSCGICQDLLPLVKDQVASGDSAALVRAHLERCSRCRQLWNPPDGELPEAPQADDRKVLFAVKRRLLGLSIGVLLLGSILGVALSNSMGMFYNFTLMPLLGAVGLFTFPKRWYVVPSGILVLTYLWLLISYGLEGSFAGGVAAGFAAPLWLAAIYALLSLLGVAVAALLRFAFRPERSGKQPQNSVKKRG